MSDFVANQAQYPMAAQPDVLAFAPGRRIHALVKRHTVLAQAAFADVALTGDSHEDWNIICKALKRIVKQAVPRRKRIARALKLKTMNLGYLVCISAPSD